MINPSAVDVSNLPSVAFSRRQLLPETRGIWFVLTAGDLKYVDSAVGPGGFRYRCSNNFRVTSGCFDEMSSTIAYLEITDLTPKQIIQMGHEFAKHFDPPANKAPLNPSADILLFAVGDRVQFKSPIASCGEKWKGWSYGTVTVTRREDRWTLVPGMYMIQPDPIQGMVQSQRTVPASCLKRYSGST